MEKIENGGDPIAVLECRCGKGRHRSHHLAVSHAVDDGHTYYVLHHMLAPEQSVVRLRREPVDIKSAVEEAMSKFVAPAKNEMKRQCEKAKARAPPTTP